MAATGQEIASAFVAITTKMPGVEKDITKQLGGIDTTAAGSQIGAKLAAGMKKTLKVAGVGVAAVLGTALVKGFGRLKAIETAQAKMRGLGHDSDTVAKAMDNALASVKGTAFGLGDAATAAGQLMAANIKPGKELEGVLKTVGNSAAAAGVGFDEMGSIFAKAASQANGIQNDVLGQLADKGIPIYQALADQMGVTAGEVFKLAQSGKIDFDTFSQAAAAAAGTVADEMGNTTTGAFDNMMAALGRLGAKILEDVFPLIGPLFKDITRNLDLAATKIEPVVAWIGERLPDALETAKGFFTGLFSWVGRNKDWLAPVLVGIGAAIVAVKTVSAVTAAWKGTTAAFKAVQAAYTAYTYGMAGATYTYEGASKAGALATKVFNAALRANPIGIIITAIVALVAGLIWFFTQTETGKKIWAEFTRFLGEAWANISGFFTAAYENVIKPVFDGIAAVVKWVWETIIRPIFSAIGFAAAILGGVIMGLYDVFVKPALDAIGAIFKWLYENVIKPVIDGIKLYIQGWGIILSWLWTSIVKPVLDAIGKAFQWAWNTVIKPAITALWDGLKVLGGWFTWLWQTIVKPVWDGISGIIKNAWERGIKPVIDTLVRVIQSDPKKAFEAARDAIGSAWKGIQELAAKPVRFVVDTVINGLIGTINKIPGVSIPKVSLPKGFAGGGVLPGYMAAKRDDVLMPMRSGEGVLVPEVVRGLGPGFVHALNAVGNSGGVSAVRAKFGSVGQGLAKGGLVHPMPGAVMTTGWYGYPGHSAVDLAKPQGTPIQAAGAGTVSAQKYHAMYGNMVDIQHGGGLSTRYAHMLANVAVRLGQVVKAGQVIGYEGSTGNSTGPHLHYEVMIGGRQVNPIPYLNGGGVKPLFGVIDGLTDFATNAFKKAFPGGGMWIDAAGGIMSQGVKSIVGWATDLLSVGGAGLVPTLYDNGGWLQPGVQLVQNKTGRPEPILTAQQWADMRGGRGEIREVNMPLHVTVDSNTDPVLFGMRSGHAMGKALTGLVV